MRSAPLPPVSLPTDSVRKYSPASADAAVKLRELPAVDATVPAATAEIGGRRNGPEPTRFGDWEKQGRCIDF